MTDHDSGALRDLGDRGEGKGAPGEGERGPRRRRRRRSRKPGDVPPKRGGLQGRAEEISASLRKLLLELYQERSGSPLPAQSEARVEIQFFVEQETGTKKPDGDRSQPSIRTPSGREIVTGLSEVIDEIAIVRQVFRQGHVFCYWCETSSCEHSLPPASQHVFSGYSPTGMPQWTEFTAALIESKDPRIEALYRRPPTVVSVFKRGSELKTNQLRVFGRSSRSFNILAQVTAGFLLVEDPPGSRDRQNLALSIQAVETRGRRGEIALDLNVLGITPGGRRVASLLGESFDPRLERVLVSARQQLRDLEAVIRKGGRSRKRKVKRSTALLAPDLEKVAQLVLRLGRGLEKVYRQRGRRTRHVEEHVEHGGRPTAKALEDVQAVDPDRILVDRRRGTFVVPGPRSRVHVFGQDGKHVTSLVLPGDKIERRLTTRRWRSATQDEVEQFLARIEELIQGGADD